MLEITHTAEPEILKRYKEDYPGPYTSDSWKHYKDYESEKAHDKVVIKELHSMQEGLCVYCERRIFRVACEQHPEERDRQVEHLKCRSAYPQETLTFTNMALSCISQGPRSKMTCGNKKGSQNLPILPTEKHGHLFDINFSTGELVPDLNASDQETKDVKECIRILNLNEATLASERKAILEKFEEIQQMLAAYTEDENSLITRYCRERTMKGEPYAHTFRKAFAKYIR